MSTALSSSVPASILVVDDDRRVVELLTIALNAYGYRVIAAADGDEALRLAARERPDLVVLDVRLPKRSGYEVCEALRQDPEDPQIPIIMVSAAAETESRLQGLARGADDYVAKPFSPKELIARIRRLLTRSAESRDAGRRRREAEHELTQAREEAKRSHAELRGEQRLRELTHVFTREFHAQLDHEALMRRLLLQAQAHLGTSLVVLMIPDEADGVLRPAATRGDCFPRAAALAIRPEGELATLLAGLGRPTRARELQRFAELRAELKPFVAAGVSVFAPLRGAQGLAGLLVADERTDGGAIVPDQLDAVAVLCETVSLALGNAARSAAQADALMEALETLAARELAPRSLASRAEAAALATVAAGPLPPAARRRVACAIRIAEWTGSEPGSLALATMAARDASGCLARLARLIEQARASEIEWIPDDDPDLAAAAVLARVGIAYAAARDLGRSSEEALREALARSGAPLDDPAVTALRESILPA